MNENEMKWKLIFSDFNLEYSETKWQRRLIGSVYMEIRTPKLFWCFCVSFRSRHRIDRKMSSSQTNYKLDEAQAIFNELRSIKKAISSGEKERQDLIQVSCCSNTFTGDVKPAWLGIFLDTCTYKTAKPVLMIAGVGGKRTRRWNGTWHYWLIFSLTLLVKMTGRKVVDESELYHKSMLLSDIRFTIWIRI